MNDPQDVDLRQAILDLAEFIPAEFADGLVQLLNNPKLPSIDNGRLDLFPDITTSKMAVLLRFRFHTSIPEHWNPNKVMREFAPIYRQDRRSRPRADLPRCGERHLSGPISRRTRPIAAN